MSIQLSPGEQFVVVRQLADHTDNTTYYVKATVRDARTDTLLTSFGLTDKGNRRFSKSWQVVADSSGLGRYISILTEVFTDAGMTTKASNYGDEMETYLVLERKGGNSTGGGGSNIDYKKIKKLIDDAIEGIEPTTIPELSLEPVLKALNAVKVAVKAIEMPEMPEQKDVDLSPVISEIKERSGAILEAVEAIPARDQNDIQPLADAIRDFDLSPLTDTVQKAVADFSSIMDGMREFSESSPELQAKMEEVGQDFKDILYHMTVAGFNAREKLPSDKEKKDVVPSKFVRLAGSFRNNK